jgi:hypothetical protein
MKTAKENIVSLPQLKTLAVKCCYLNLAGLVIFLGISLFADVTQELSIICGILAILISLFPIAYSIEKKKIALVFTGIAVFNIAPVWFLYLESVLPGYDAFSYTQPLFRVLGFLWISIFQLLVNLVYVLLWNRGHNFSVRSFSFLKSIRFKPVFYTRMAILIFTIPLVVFYLYYGSMDLLWTALTAGRSEGSSGMLIRDSVGGSESLMLPFTWIWQLTPVFACIAWITAPRKSRIAAGVCLLLALFVIFVFFLSGSRGSMMFVAAPPLFFLFYYNWHRGIRFWLPVSLLIIALIAIMEIQVRFRGNLLEVISDPAKAAKMQDLRSITTFDPTQSQRDNNMYLFCLMLKSYPEKYSYEGFNDFFAVLANPVPRSLWQGKPVLNGAKDISNQSSFILSGPLTMGTTSLSFSIVGDAYKTAGLFGMLIYSILYGAFLLYFDGILYYADKKQPLSVAILGMVLFLAFWGYRAFFALISFLYPVLLLLIFFRIVKMFRTK